MAFGLEYQSELYDEESNTWLPYLDMPADRLNSLDCLVQFGDKIYGIRYEQIHAALINSNLSVEDSN